MEIRKRIFWFGLVFLSLGILPASPGGMSLCGQCQAEDSSRDASARACWNDFLSAFGNLGQWQVSWDPETGVPARIIGPGIPLEWKGDPSVLQEAALTFYRHFQDLFGLVHSDLVPRESAESRNLYGGSHYFVSFQQFFRGIPVTNRGGRVSFHRMGERLVLSGISTCTLPIPSDFKGDPLLSEDEAVQVAMDTLSGEYPFAAFTVQNSELVIFPLRTGQSILEPRLSFMLTLEGTAEEWGKWTLFIDARSGVKLHSQDEIMRMDYLGSVAGRVVTGPCADGPLEEVPFPYLKVKIQEVGETRTDISGNWVVPNSDSVTRNCTTELDGTYARIFDIKGRNINFSGSATPGVFLPILLNQDSLEWTTALANAYYHTTQVHDWYKNITGHTEMDFQAIVVVNDASGHCNSFFDGTKINLYRSGNGCVNTAFSSVIYHEYGHWIDRIFGTVFYNDGFNEGMSDMLSAFILGDPRIACGLYGPGTELRNCDNDKEWPGWECSTLHERGMIWSGYAWHARKNLIAMLGYPAGTAVAGYSFIHLFKRDPSSQPDGVNETFLLDDDDGDLNNGSPHFWELRDAADRHNLPRPSDPETPITILHSGLPDTPDAANPYPVVAQIFSGAGKIYPQALCYSTGGNYHTLIMIPTGNPNEYMACIPPQPFFTTVTYYIDAMDKAGNRERLPKESPRYATFSFIVGIVEDLLVDDMESGEGGWVHGATSGVDDWMLGTPNPMGQSLYDPARAHSGENVWGNNLSGAGLYSNNSSSYLESPAVDCTGKRGVHLRFYRWLTIEENDRAKIFVNDACIWENPQDSPLRDNQWILQEFDISGLADNNPSVTIRFDLTTDNNLVIMGGWNIDDFRIFTLNRPPAIFSLSPSHGHIVGWSKVTVQGEGFTDSTDTVATFDGLPGMNLTVVDSKTLTVYTPPHAAGPVDVAVTTSFGSAILPGGFTYSERPVLYYLGGNPQPGGYVGFRIEAPDRPNQGILLFANTRSGTTRIGPPYNITLDVPPWGIRVFYNALTNHSNTPLNGNGVIMLPVRIPYPSGETARFQAIVGVLSPSPDLVVSEYYDLLIQ